ncbi:MAG: hypothetical protein ACRDZM_03210 [Acidimicrobiia bacterium]
MRLTRMIMYVALGGLLSVLVTACDDDATQLSTTSSIVSSPSPTVEASTTSVASSGDSTTTSLVGQAVGDYEVVARESGTAGETLYIVIPPGAYTDVDIENFVVDLVESGAATFGAEIFDDPAAADAFRKPEAERTEDETALLAQHHFVSLQNASTIVYRGPFESSGQQAIGS